MSSRKARIAIATKGRYHVLDLARELSGLGYDVRFYSALPSSRIAKFGLDPACGRSVLLPMAVPLAWERFARGAAAGARERIHDAVLNRAIVARLAPCDIFIGMSGLIVEAAEYAKRRYGARVIAERGNKHILAQQDILRAGGAAGPSDHAVARELRSYELADRIMIPADHCAISFERDPAARAKLLTNPYGADIDLFRPSERSRTPGRHLLFVGSWGKRKGCDILVRAMEKVPDARLTHVGPITDLPFPGDPRFTHIDAVDQPRLVEHYRSADLFVLASLEEGLALVQVQALATGLPLVCTDQTGGRDLRLSPGLAERIDEVPAGDADALAAAIRARLDTLPLRPIAQDDRAFLSWRHYAERYASFIEDLLARTPPE